MKSGPNTVLYAVVGVASAGALVLVILAAESHGRRRQARRAWLREAGGAA